MVWTNLGLPDEAGPAGPGWPHGGITGVLPSIT